MEALLHGHVHLGLGFAAAGPGGLLPVGLRLCQLGLQVSNHLLVSHLHDGQTEVIAGMECIRGSSRGSAHS